MFANVLRSQARLALTACRARVSALPVARVATRIPSIPIVSASRTLSTSRVVLNWNSDRPAPEPSNTLFVGNLPYSISEEELRATFERYGKVSSIRVAHLPDGRPRGFAHIEFEQVDDAVGVVASVAEEPMYLLDRDLRVNYASRSNKAAAAPREPSNTLYFHGFQGNADELREAASEFDSSIVNVHFLRSRDTGMETGAGFLHFNSVERATEALSALNGRTVAEGEVLRLRFAAPPRERGSRDNRDNRDNRGGNGGRGRY
ncbi:hypothetical protein H0H87_007876 [Tephrocybe sp. NHM501043]|nr:hypothetical protein H0H87_007876 [Tephrocybe sp. NHM501043]